MASLTNRFTPEKGDLGFLRDNLGRATNVVCSQFTNAYAYNPDNELTNMLGPGGPDGVCLVTGRTADQRNGPLVE